MKHVTASTIPVILILLQGQHVALGLAPSSRTPSSQQDTACSSRKQFLHNALAAVGVVASSQVLPSPASASLLDEYGADPSKIQQKPTAVAVTVTPKEQSSIEPNLRSNYYYPTNKKRYLPRIKKCNDMIREVSVAIGDGEWDTVSEFASKTADDTILPLKLYASSLTGGGTNVKVSYVKTMNKDADRFEAAQKALVKAVSKKNTEAASTALEAMASSLQDYRTVAGLTGPDGGGDIPSVDDIRRAACRVQGRTFEKTVKARDARIKDEIVVDGSTGVAGLELASTR